MTCLKAAQTFNHMEGKSCRYKVFSLWVLALAHFIGLYHNVWPETIVV